MPGQENTDSKGQKRPKKPTYILWQLGDGGITLERPRYHRTRPSEYRTSDWSYITILYISTISLTEEDRPDDFRRP